MNPYPAEVWLNGQWLPHKEALVSVFDRGFLFGDGIYEVIPFYRRRPFTLNEHLHRLQDGLNAVSINYRVDSLRQIIVEAIDRANLMDGITYIQVTRGVAPRKHRFPSDAQPTVLLYTTGYDFAGFETTVAEVVLVEDFRWHRCNIKSVSLMANVLANQYAVETGMTETILCRDGVVTEGSHTSVFFVRGGSLFTHPEGPRILPGITRRIVLELARKLEIEVREEAIRVDEINRVSESFLTGTTTQLTAIGTILNAAGDRFQLGKTAGPVTRRLQQAFIELVDRS